MSPSETNTPDLADLLTPPMLESFRERAAENDRTNSFFHADLEDLKDSGYLRLMVPTDLGGHGATLAQAAAAQGLLAQAAPATALGVNMHLVITGIASAFHARGDSSLDFILRDAAAGHLFAFGNSEAGNDAVMFDSLTKAKPQPDGSYRLYGTKIFTTLSPAWTRLATFGKDTTGEEPRLVHGVVRREDGGTIVHENWDTLGMRATQSHTTVLDGALIRPGNLVRNLPVGPNADRFVFTLFAYFEVLLAAVYTGIAERALELAVESAHRRTSHKSGRTYAQDPDIRRRVAAAAMAMDGLRPQIAALSRDVDAGVDHGARWFSLLVGLKVRATENARHVVDQAVRVAGGGSYFNSSELGRLYRDVLAGIFHPSDDESAHATVATAWLGPLEP